MNDKSVQHEFIITDFFDTRQSPLKMKSCIAPDSRQPLLMHQ